MSGGGDGRHGQPTATKGDGSSGSVDREEKRERPRRRRSRPGTPLFDPYFNIVEVKVYGQARFYNPPRRGSRDAEPSRGRRAPAGRRHRGRSRRPTPAPAQAEAKAEPRDGRHRPKDDAPKAERPRQGRSDAEGGGRKADAPAEAGTPLRCRSQGREATPAAQARGQAPVPEA